MRLIATLDVPVKVIRPLICSSAKPGLPLSYIERELEVPTHILGDSREAAVDLADYFRILERVAVSTHDETWGLSARPLLPGATGLVLSSLSTCTTLLEATKAVARAYNLLHGGTYNRVELHENRLTYIIDDRGFPYAPHMGPPQMRFTMVSVLMFLHGLLALIAGDALHGRLMRVHIKGTPLSASHGYLRFWPVPIRWRSNTYALDYDVSASSLPIVRVEAIPSSRAIYRKVQDLIQRDPHVGCRVRSMRDQVLEAFEDNVFDQNDVARRLGLSVATLRRRLRAENSASFRALSEHVRERAAKLLLGQHHHPNDVAEELGFSDLRSFARAFKRWTGITPAAHAGSCRR
jgi:AraC-like DNA-binding protein